MSTGNPESESSESQKVSSSFKAHRNMVWDRFLRKIGTRYGGCRFGNYELSRDAQAAQRQILAIDALRAFCEQIHEKTAEGAGLMLLGTCGTGKDHLMVSAAYEAVSRGMEVVAIYGSTLYTDIGSTIGSEATQKIDDVVKRLAEPQILAISDLRPSSGNLNSYQKDSLYQIITERYKHMKPTWMTANATGKEQLEQCLTAPVVSRLAHGALTIKCEWPDWRLQK